MLSNKQYLVIAGVLSVFAALLHISIIIGGPDWYRFFGAGEEMAKMAEQGMTFPAFATSSISIVLFIWSAYAFSGAGIIIRLPFIRTGLVIISMIFMIRAIFGITLVNYIDQPYYNELAARPTFMVISSLICFIYGLFYIIGTVTSWRVLSIKAHSNITNQGNL